MSAIIKLRTSCVTCWHCWQNEVFGGLTFPSDVAEKLVNKRNRYLHKKNWCERVRRMGNEKLEVLPLSIYESSKHNFLSGKAWKVWGNIIFYLHSYKASFPPRTWPAFGNFPPVCCKSCQVYLTETINKTYKKMSKSSSFRGTNKQTHTLAV